MPPAPSSIRIMGSSSTRADHAGERHAIGAGQGVGTVARQPRGRLGRCQAPARRARHPPQPWSGSATSTARPPRSCDPATVTSAPCAAAMRRTMDQPSPLPGCPVPDDPEEALAQAAAIDVGHAGTTVLDPQLRLCRSMAQGYSNLGAGRAVAHRVVDQVAHQHAQQRGVALHVAGLAGLEVDPLPFRYCLRDHVGHGAAHHLDQVHFRAVHGGARIPAATTSSTGRPAVPPGRTPRSWPRAHGGARSGRSRPAPPAPASGCAAIGVRSSCAASAVKRRSDSSRSAMRPAGC